MTHIRIRASLCGNIPRMPKIPIPRDALHRELGIGQF